MKRIRNAYFSLGSIKSPLTRGSILVLHSLRPLKSIFSQVPRGRSAALGVLRKNPERCSPYTSDI